MEARGLLNHIYNRNQQKKVAQVYAIVRQQCILHFEWLEDKTIMRIYKYSMHEI